MPTATSCNVRPGATVGLAGDTAIDDNVGAATVRVVPPLTPDRLAEMVLDPVATVVASPCEPAAFDIVAAELFDDAHVTDVVRSCVEPSEYVPVAANCWVSPLGTEGFAGVTAIEERDAVVAVSAVDPVTPNRVAEIVVFPAVTMLASPCVPPAFEMVATEELDEAHVTELVMSCVDPSEYAPFAENCIVTPMGTEGFEGVTAIDDSVAEITARVVEPETVSSVAEIVVVPGLRVVARP